MVYLRAVVEEGGVLVLQLEGGRFKSYPGHCIANLDKLLISYCL